MIWTCRRQLISALLIAATPPRPPWAKASNKEASPSS